MKDLLRIGLTLLAFTFFIGCDNSDDDDEDDEPFTIVETPTGGQTMVPRISGNWAGIFFRTNESSRTNVTARISQSGDAITITTSLPEDIGARFTGSIDSDGDMKLTDPFDGEVWTTHFRPATTNAVTIADFISAPTALEPDKPLKVIQLRRR